MQLEPVISALRANLLGHGALAGGDQQIEAAVAQLADALEPAVRTAALDLAQQAAAEVDAQLADHDVSVVLTGADIELRVTERESASSIPADEELDARITLRLPPTLKSTIERFATGDGESVNSWVVDALSRRARRSPSSSSGSQISEEFDL